jgi:hypothetical protein
MTPADFEIAKKAVSVAAGTFQTPTWRRPAQKMEKDMEAGQEPDPKDLEFVLTVLDTGKVTYTKSIKDFKGNETHPPRLAIENAIPLRDRLRKAA